MKYYIVTALIIIINQAAFSQGLLKYDNKCMYINGVNLPWHYFGADIGTHYKWGSLYDSRWFDSSFRSIRQYGINCIRFWLHCDGRASPEFDSNGFVAGLDSNFFYDLDDFFTKARKYGLYVVLCLWSYDMLKDRTAEAGIYAGRHNLLITDSLHTLSYIEDALIPIVERYKDEASLIAYDIINEPEWCIQSNDTKNCEYSVTLNEMQRFVGLCAAAVHKYSGKFVTLGSGSLKWNSYNAGSIANYWDDASIFNAAGDTLARLDFYEIHYYDWMADAGFNPFASSPLFWGLDKPVIIGELPAKAGRYDINSMLRTGLSNGWAGAITWSYLSQDSGGSWDYVKNEQLKFCNDFYSLIQPSDCESKYELSMNGDISIFPNPSKDLIKIYLKSKDIKKINARIYDILGNLQYTSITEIFENEHIFYIDLTTLPKGNYILKIGSQKLTAASLFLKM